MRAPAAAAASAVLLLAGCVPASPDVDTYRDKAVRTLGSAVSEVRTVSRLVSTSHDGRILKPTVKAQLRYSEGALETATGAFTELNPPPSQDPLNKRVSTLLGDASDLLAEARIALEREESARYPVLVRRLERMATNLERLEARVR